MAEHVNLLALALADLRLVEALLIPEKSVRLLGYASRPQDVRSLVAFDPQRLDVVVSVPPPSFSPVIQARIAHHLLLVPAVQILNHLHHLLLVVLNKRVSGVGIVHLNLHHLDVWLLVID